MNRERVLSRLESFEGSTAYLYRCTGGDVTAGVGHALLSAADALNLNWQIAGRPATPDEISADYDKVAAAPKGSPAEQYEPLTLCRLGADDIEQVAGGDITAFEAALKGLFPAWDSFPEPAQEALFDMGFNLGIAGLRKFVKLLAAVQAGNWEGAAAESHRQGISEARNQEIAALFNAATTPNPVLR